MQFVDKIHKAVLLLGGEVNLVWHSGVAERKTMTKICRAGGELR